MVLVTLPLAVPESSTYAIGGRAGVAAHAGTLEASWPPTAVTAAIAVMPIRLRSVEAPPLAGRARLPPGAIGGPDIRTLGEGPALM